MNKKLVSLIVMLLFVSGSVLTAQAESYQGKSSWKVSFTGEKMESNFGSQSVNDNLPNQFQPGDDVTFTVDLENKADFTTDWYMTNDVLSTLEESQSVANSGNYTYRLSYKNNAGKTTVLYDSENVGGEKSTNGGEGLHEATDSLGEYLYLDRLKANETGQVSLYLKVDGETQGNAYQDTLAKLRMNFAVEKANESTGTTPASGGNNDPARQPGRDSVKTGDTNHMLIWAVIALISGLVLLIAAFIRRREEKESKGAAAAKKAVARALAVGMLLSLFSAEVKAADENYTYTITFYAGNQGTFADGSSKIQVTGKKLGDTVIFNLDQVRVSDESRYYVKGIRRSGRDNSTSSVENLAVNVTADADYTVAYGIKGDLVAYTVNYHDTNGNTLSPSRTYYGNAGDKPVVAFLYVEGYQPQAYNLTKTLSGNEAENVFTFEYERVGGTTPAATNPGTGNGTGNTAGGGTGGAAGGGGAAQGAAGAAQGAAGAAQGAAGAGGAAAGADAEPEAPLTEVPDEAVPTANQTDDLIDLDDEEVPLANMGGNEDAETVIKPYMWIAAAGIILAAGIGLFVWLKRRKKQNEE